MNILQIEDDESLAWAYKDIFKEIETKPTESSLVQVSNLSDFQRELTRSGEYKRFFLDGSFPETRDGSEAFLLPDALRLLRSYSGKVEKVFVLSARKPALLQGAINSSGITNLAGCEVRIFPKDMRTDVDQIFRGLLS